ncbi:hypothetical protein ASPZODRAFT_138863 [Penicilliopsis zonata CBS 506.65]|uniref:NACHT domain-containing protein n=1 Tax=Penicilliopsis zonata CBS 506.65 TaxID=1073090 RepID=A0A1L9SXE9_9EURO|nr:hypothetical protein ASPZODRAFT_138863 [Penicilliopsis zonata CBS 506.65]OJJ51807.1 hypothetical protein ASPZODRAFT_138863 [Penicilliopsis zonata CBS 506.65]
MTSISSRPIELSDFIDRWQDTSIGVAEKAALQEWSTTAIDYCLTSDTIRKFAWESARLSQVLDTRGSTRLLRQLVNAIIEGTTDGTSLDPVLLQSLAYTIRQREAGWSFDSTEVLASLFTSLKARLEQADAQGGLERKYELLCVLSVVVDAMVDIGVSNISHEQLYKPLIDLLDKFSKDKELHVAQAANYAAQALRGIPDDDTIGKASLRGLIRAVDIGTTLASAATSIDLAALWEAAKSTLGAVASLEDFILDTFKTRTGKSWYTALRMTSVLIRTKSWTELEHFIRVAESRNNPDFLCGLYAQLDRVSETHQKGILKCIPRSQDDRVQAWRNYLGSESSEESQHSQSDHRRFRNLKRSKTFQWSFKACGWEDSRRNFTDHSNNFLYVAYQKCPAAKEYYTKNALIQFYTEQDNKRLQIQRLSGDTLPMNHCYINLTVLGDSSDDEVSFTDLFSPRERNGKVIHPKRIFIEGQAGVGKTTLCKKMVHDFIYKNQWSALFGCILWLPLRHLKGKSANAYSLGDLFYDEYFSQHFDGRLLADTLFSLVQKEGARVLFILDGLDEVSQEWDIETSMDRFLQTLLGQSRVIISSRPYSMRQLNKDTLDLQLRTVGFSSEQIKKYVHAPEIQSDAETASRIWLFIQEHP